MPKYYFLNFFVLSSDLIVLAFNKGTLMIFDDRNILIDDDEENDDKNIEEKKYPMMRKNIL